MGNIKEINIKNHTSYFFSGINNIEDFYSNLLKLDKKWYKNIDIHYTGYITIKSFSDYNSINSVNLLYFIIGEVYGYIEEKNRNRYLVFPSTDKNKEVLTKCTELWGEIKSLIDKINDKPDEYRKGFMKIKFNSDGNLPLNKIINVNTLLTILLYVNSNC